MGFYMCAYCIPGAETRFHNVSSGDVTLVFDSGRSWEMPDMILHYIVDHEWLPPYAFYDDVMSRKCVGGQRIQTRSIIKPTRIGYLSGPYTKGIVTKGFVEKLESLMKQVNREYRIQYRRK